LLATVSARVGILLLKQSVGGLAKNQSRGLGPLVLGLLHSNLGLLGIGLQLLGIVLFLIALSDPSAPISILQPLRAFGIVVMAFLSVVYLNERLGVLEWLGVGLQIIGITLLGCSLLSTETQSTSIEMAPFVTYLMALAALCGCFVVVLRFAINRNYVETSYGALAGILLGVAYLHMKVIFIARLENRNDIAILSVAMTLFGSLGGFAVLLWSFRSCRALVVTTINFVVNQLVVVIGGPICLGEQLPTEPLQLWSRVAGIIAILVGVVLLARFQSAPAPQAVPAR
jgi:drug/metabolite transporter (DMT)-like permease